MPRDFLDFESEIKTAIKDQFKRGSVDVYVSRRYKEKGVKVSVETHQEYKVLGEGF
ncbi:MAG: YicC/YloC family endoribonuclease [Bdellovibrionales bacterium]